MENVEVLFYEDDEDSYIIGLFSNKEKAEREKQDLIEREGRLPEQLTIVTWEVK